MYPFIILILFIFHSVHSYPPDFTKYKIGKFNVNGENDGQIFQISGNMTTPNAVLPVSNDVRSKIGARRNSILFGSGHNGAISLFVFGGYGYHYLTKGYLNDLWLFYVFPHREEGDPKNFGMWLPAGNEQQCFKVDYSELDSFSEGYRCPPGVEHAASFYIRRSNLMIYYGGIGKLDSSTEGPFQATWGVKFNSLHTYGALNDPRYFENIQVIMFRRFNSSNTMSKLVGAAGFTHIGNNGITLVLFGGYGAYANSTGNFTFQNDLYVMKFTDYDPKVLSWKKVVLNDDNVPTKRAFMSHYMMDGYAYIIGGITEWPNNIPFYGNTTKTSLDMWRIPISSFSETSSWEVIVPGNTNFELGLFGRFTWSSGNSAYFFGGSYQYYDEFQKVWETNRLGGAFTHYDAVDIPHSMSWGASYMESVYDYQSYQLGFFPNEDMLSKFPFGFFEKFAYNDLYLFGGESDEGLFNTLILLKIPKTWSEITHLVFSFVFVGYFYITLTIIIVASIILCCLCFIIWCPVCTRQLRKCQRNREKKQRLSQKLKKRKNYQQKKLRKVLLECKCEDYVKAFKKEGILYDDIEGLVRRSGNHDSQLRKLIPNKAHRIRLLDYAKKKIIKDPKWEIPDQTSPMEVSRQSMQQQMQSMQTIQQLQRELNKLQEMARLQSKQMNMGFVPSEQKKFEEETVKCLDKIKKNKLFIDESLVNTSRIIAKGAFGTVREGTFQVTKIANLSVAVKEVLVGDQSGATPIADVEHEVRVMAEMDHTNILKCYGFFLKDGCANIVMELCERGDLYKYKKTLSRKQKLNFILQICRGVGYLHSKNLVHRDLKTQNLLITKDNFVKLCDFGTTKHVQSMQQSFVGTVEYLPPEQLNTDLAIDASPRLIDIYSFGVIMWEILTGKQPFLEVKKECGGNQMLMLKKIHDGKLRPPLEDVVKQWDADLVELIKACWAHYPYKRPESFSEIEAVLMEVAKSETEKIKKKSDILKSKLNQLKLSEKAKKDKEKAEKEKAKNTKPHDKDNDKDNDIELQSINPSIQSISPNPSIKSLDGSNVKKEEPVKKEKPKAKPFVWEDPDEGGGDGDKLGSDDEQTIPNTIQEDKEKSVEKEKERGSKSLQKEEKVNDELTDILGVKVDTPTQREKSDSVVKLDENKRPKFMTGIIGRYNDEEVIIEFIGDDELKLNDKITIDMEDIGGVNVVPKDELVKFEIKMEEDDDEDEGSGVEYNIFFTKENSVKFKKEFMPRMEKIQESSDEENDEKKKEEVKAKEVKNLTDEIDVGNDPLVIVDSPQKEVEKQEVVDVKKEEDDKKKAPPKTFTWEDPEEGNNDGIGSDDEQTIPETIQPERKEVTEKVKVEEEKKEEVVEEKSTHPSKSFVWEDPGGDSDGGGGIGSDDEQSVPETMDNRQQEEKKEEEVPVVHVEEKKEEVVVEEKKEDDTKKTKPSKSFVWEDPGGDSDGGIGSDDEQNVMETMDNSRPNEEQTLNVESESGSTKPRGGKSFVWEGTDSENEDD